MSKLPDWFLWKRYNWKTVGLQAMSLPYDITTEQVNMEVKDLCIPFPVPFLNQLFIKCFYLFLLCEQNLHESSFCC